METLLQNLNYQLITKKEKNSEIELLVINNTDGSPRWICNANAQKALFLKFYTIINLRTFFISVGFKLAFALRLQKIVFKTIKINIESCGENVFNITDIGWTLFTGTAGPNNKYILYNEKNNTFTKIATTPKSIELLNKESEVIQSLTNYNFTSFITPEIIKHSTNYIALKAIIGEEIRTHRFIDTHINVLNEIYSKSIITNSLHSYFEQIKIENQLNDLKNSTKISRNIIDKLLLLYNSFSADIVALGLSHGDFTPWNMYVCNDAKLAIYDWELSNFKKPIGFDAFHFIIQKGILIERKNWKKIKEEIYQSISEENVKTWSNNEKSTIDYYLKLYILINTTYYLRIYDEQKNWHVQINWLLSTWSEAVTDMCVNEKCVRKLLINDIFENVKDINYATIKFTNEMPETLSEYSDIDICLGKKDAFLLLNYLKNHSLVKKYFISIKSYMISVQLLVGDKIICLDLIWQLKWKNYEILNFDTIITNSFKNKYNIKVMSNEDSARFVALFYGLNNAEIPEKYQKYLSYLNESNTDLDAIINNSVLNKKQLLNYVETKSENTSLNYIVNTVNYFKDVFSELIHSKGLIITFSGVDGAGKSTVIENIKNEIEKKLRKKVIIIRHRPSLLPILSAITKGKKEAEKISMNNLPRTGSNKSTLSSLFRFMYYYLDYLIGQIVVLIKYKSRGYVVLYDRYYFDFIVDAKRSNIVLSSKLIKWAYRFIIEPDLNFFLYANSSTILSRKKELDSQTINELNSKYKTLFSELNVNSNKYHSIINEDLSKTITRLFSETVIAFEI